MTDRMIAAVEEQAQSPQWLKDGGQFIPNPATWLRRGSWEDLTEIELATPVDQPAYKRLKYGFNPVAFLAKIGQTCTDEQIARLDADETIKDVLTLEQSQHCFKEIKRLRDVHEYGVGQY